MLPAGLPLRPGTRGAQDATPDRGRDEQMSENWEMPGGLTEGLDYGPDVASPPKAYLAARYSRRLELCRYRAELTRLGITVTSRWLNGSHQIDNQGVPIGDDGERRFEMGDPALAHWREHFAAE